MLNPAKENPLKPVKCETCFGESKIYTNYEGKQITKQEFVVTENVCFSENCHICDGEGVVYY